MSLQFKRNTPRDYSNLKVLFEDTSQTSPKFFRVSDVPQVLTKGKNLLRISAHPSNLVPNSQIIVDIKDANGDPIYFEVPDYLEQDKSRVISIWIYHDKDDENTANGDATITIYGIARVDQNGKQVPSRYRGKHNVKWSTTINVDRDRENISPVIFKGDILPTISISESIEAYQNLPSTGTELELTTQTGGGARYIYKGRTPIVQLTDGSEFNQEMVEYSLQLGNFETPATPETKFENPTNITSYTSSIKELIDSTTVILNTPFITTFDDREDLTHTFTSIESADYSISYFQTSSNIVTENERSYANLTINNVNPISGYPNKLRVLIKSDGLPGDYELLNEVTVPFSSSLSVKIPIPSEHLDDPKRIKIQYLNSIGEISRTETITEPYKFEGGNTYIGGRKNLISGSMFISNALGSGIEMGGVSSGFIRSVGYEGITSASLGKGPGGFIIYSGSGNLQLGDDVLTGVGMQMVGDNDDRHLIFTTDNGGLLDVKTDKFFIGTTNTQFISGSGGNIEISSSLFHLDPQNNLLVIGADAVINADLTVNNLRTPALINGAPSTRNNSSSSIDEDGFARFVSASIGGFEVSETQINSANDNLILKDSGQITGSNVSFTGGKIAGFEISDSQLNSTNNNIILKASGQLTASDGFLFGNKGSEQYVQFDDGNLVVRGDLSVDQIFTPATIGGSPSNITNASSSITSDGFAKFVSASIGGWSVDTGSIQGSNIIMLPEGTIQTRDFATNVKGWKISSLGNGTAEFENVRIRGTLKTAVFEKETVNAVGGQLYVANSTTITGSAEVTYNTTSSLSLVSGSWPIGSENGAILIDQSPFKGRTFAIDIPNELSYITGSTTITDYVGNQTSVDFSGRSDTGISKLPENGYGSLIISDVTGGADRGLYFNSSDGQQVYNNQFTAVVWVKAYDYLDESDSCGILWKNQAYGFRITNNVGFQYFVYDTAYKRLENGFVVGLDEWYHVALTLSGSTFKAYLNGEYQSQRVDIGVVSSDVNQSLQFGYQSTNRQLEGEIGHVSLYNRALTDAEISQSYEGLKDRYSDTPNFIDVTTTGSSANVLELSEPVLANNSWYLLNVPSGSATFVTSSIVSAESRSYDVTGSIPATANIFKVENASGFAIGEILKAKKVSNTGFATEYLKVTDSFITNPSSDTDLSGFIHVDRAYGKAELEALAPEDQVFLTDLVSLRQSYEEGQVIVSTGLIGSGYIHLNANPRDVSTPYMDIVERTGSGVYDTALKVRLGDLSGLANSDYVFGNPNPGFGLATDNVFLQGGIIANTGSIGGINMDAGKLYTGVGTWGDANTGFYLDSESSMSLSDKLRWDGNTLNISGVINIESGTGFATQTDIDAATGSLETQISNVSSSVARTSFSSVYDFGFDSTFDSNWDLSNITQSGSVDGVSLINTSSNTWDGTAFFDKTIRRENNVIIEWDFEIITLPTGSGEEGQMIGSRLNKVSGFGGLRYAVWFNATSIAIRNYDNNGTLVSNLINQGDRYRVRWVYKADGGCDLTIYKDGDFSTPYMSNSYTSGTDSELYMTTIVRGPNFQTAHFLKIKRLSIGTQLDANEYQANNLNDVSGSIVNTISTVSGSIASDIENAVDRIVTDANNKITKPNPAPSGDGLFLASSHMGYYDSSAWNAYISSSGEFLFKADDDNLISFGNNSFVLKVSDQAVISGSQISLLTPNFFFGGETQFISGANSNIEISSSNFHLQPSGDVVIGGGATIEQGAVFGVLPALPSNEKLKVYIPFEEGGGTKVFNHANESEPLTIQNSSGFTRISGSNTAYGNSLFLEGTFLQFDSGNGASAIIHDGGTQVSQSIVVWLNTPSASISTPQIIYEQNGSTNGQSLFISNGQVYWSIWTGGGTGDKRVVSSSLNDSELTMIGATVDSDINQMKIYKNGFVQQVLNAPITVGGGNPCGIGGVASSTRIISGSEPGTVYTSDGDIPYYGMIDEFRIYKEYLSDSNMLALYQNPGGISSTTKITGDNISTGQIKSNNLSATRGTLIDLNGEVFKIGGTSVTPTSGEGIVLDGSVTGQPKFFVGDTSEAFVRFGETAGALEISSSGFSLDTTGAITATEGTIGGVNIGSSKIYVGTGTFDNSNTGFYLDSSGNFSLEDKLTWDGNTLAIEGDITVTNTGDFANPNATSTFNYNFAGNGSQTLDTGIWTLLNISGETASTSGIRIVRGGSPTTTWNGGIRTIKEFPRSESPVLIFDWTQQTPSGVTTSNSGITMIGWWTGDTSNYSNRMYYGIYINQGTITVREAVTAAYEAAGTLISNNAVGDKWRCKIRLKAGGGAMLELFRNGDFITPAATYDFGTTGTLANLAFGLSQYKQGDSDLTLEQVAIGSQPATTTISGNGISTGQIESSNLSTTAGSLLNLNDGTFKLGGTSNPKLEWNGTTLNVKGAIEVENTDDFATKNQANTLYENFQTELDSTKWISANVTQSIVTTTPDGTPYYGSYFLGNTGTTGFTFGFYSTKVFNIEDTPTLVVDLVVNHQFPQSFIGFASSSYNISDLTTNQNIDDLHAAFQLQARDVRHRADVNNDGVISGETFGNIPGAVDIWTDGEDTFLRLKLTARPDNTVTWEVYKNGDYTEPIGVSTQTVVNPNELVVVFAGAYDVSLNPNQFVTLGQLAVGREVSPTRISGNSISTGRIQSTNLSATQGTVLDLDTEIVRIGGTSVTPTSGEGIVLDGSTAGQPKFFVGNTSAYVRFGETAGALEIESSGFSLDTTGAVTATDLLVRSGSQTMIDTSTGFADGRNVVRTLNVDTTGQFVVFLDGEEKVSVIALSSNSTGTLGFSFSEWNGTGFTSPSSDIGSFNTEGPITRLIKHTADLSNFGIIGDVRNAAGVLAVAGTNITFTTSQVVAGRNIGESGFQGNRSGGIFGTT